MYFHQSHRRFAARKSDVQLHRFGDHKDTGDGDQRRGNPSQFEPSDQPEEQPIDGNQNDQIRAEPLEDRTEVRDGDS